MTFNRQLAPEGEFKRSKADKIWRSSPDTHLENLFWSRWMNTEQLKKTWEWVVKVQEEGLKQGVLQKEKGAATAVSSPGACRVGEWPQGYESDWQGGCGIIKIRSEERFKRKK